jgi:Ca2+-binding EF-hand superfamily protein
MAQLNITEKVLNLDTDNVFRIFDDDDNNLVDSLEFLSSFALLSGMTPEEKIRFIFALYDFDESSVLTLDEMVLAFRSTLSGLSKLSSVDPPSESEIEIIVVQGTYTLYVYTYICIYICM